MKTFLVGWREISLRRNMILIFCVIVAALAVLYTSIYPALQHQASQLINSLGNVYKDVGVEGKVSFGTLQSYMSLEMFGVTWPILVTVFTAGLAGAALAGEIEKGTLGMLLALPVRRTNIYLSKYLSGLLALVTLIVATVCPILVIALIGHMRFQFSHFASVALLCLLFGSAVFSLSLLLSAFLNEKTHLYGSIGGIMIVMYVINTIAGLKPSLESIKYASFFHYFDASSALTSNHIAGASYAVFITVSVVASILGALAFNKRDISI